MSSRITLLNEENRKLTDVYKPLFFRLSDKENKEKFYELIEQVKPFVFDEIADQLKELVKSRNPSASFDANDYKLQINKHLNGCDTDEYGVWVYYPWSQRLVHLLDEDEFIELRTAANKNKITTAERYILAGKKVGVIGLSVGQSVSVTLALERGCGELRLADFDTLELNNLNRIRTGVHNLGLLKAYAVAREIAEIDPFFKVVCYTDGITEDNISSFLQEGGKLDVVIDECDSVNIKILCRIKAKELHIPVLMEASDKGTFDVERFDLHPDRPIMHGWLQHLELDFDVLKNLKTNEEKVPYMLPISGLDTLSSRMRASMIELRSTITTWPQLASAVTLGGALAADTCRRIFLDQFTDSGRYFIDLETLIPDTRPVIRFEPAISLPQLSVSVMDELSGRASGSLAQELSLSSDEIKELVSAAIKAPSAGNAQPWKWYAGNGGLFLFYEDTGILSFGDHERSASYIALGAAIENMKLAALQKGYDTVVHPFPIAAETRLIAGISFIGRDAGQVPAENEDLFNYIDKRITNRNAGTKEVIPAEILAKLAGAVASVSGAQLIIKSSPEDLNSLASVIGPVERLKLLNPPTHYEFFQKEIRWSDEESRESGDGVSINALCISGQEELALKMIKNPDAIKLLAEWNAGQALQYTARKAIATASAFGLITMPDDCPVSYLNGGMAMERMWLTAAKYGIAIQPMLTPLVFFKQYIGNNKEEMPGFIAKDLPDLYARFNELFPGTEQVGKVFLFKIGIAPAPSSLSCRKPVNKVLYFAET